MEYDEEFELCFIKRTKEILINYSGDRDATLLINCLLGLLIVPKEKFFTLIPNTPIQNLKEWGITESSIKNWGKCSEVHDHAPTLNEFIRHLRNAVAHFQIKPIQNGNVQAFEFEDHNFKLNIQLADLKRIILKLSDYLSNERE